MSRVEPNPGDFARQVGRRARRLAGGLFGIGVEILPYELVGVVTAADGTKLGAMRVDLATMAIDAVVRDIARLAHRLAAAVLDLELSDPRLCLGVALGAPVDPVAGIVRYYANGPFDHGQGEPPYFWIDERLADRIEQATGCSTVIDNDAHALATYEQKLGAGSRTASFAVLLIRHGIGAGVVLDDKLLSIPAEVGHLMVWPDGRLCDCGLGAHVESWAGRRAIPAVVAEKTGLDGAASFEWAVNLANGNHPMAARAAEAFAEAGTAIARGIAAILTVFGSPHLIIHAPEELVGRGSGRAAEAFLRAVHTFPRYTFPHIGVCTLTTRPLTLDCGAVGAALIALNRHFSTSLAYRPEAVS